MVFTIQPNQNYYGVGGNYTSNEKIKNMNCNAVYDKAAEEIAKKYNKTTDIINFSSKPSEQERYEEFLKMQAAANPLMFMTPLFIYEVAKERAANEDASKVTETSKNSSKDINHSKETLKFLPGGWWFNLK